MSSSAGTDLLAALALMLVFEGVGLALVSSRLRRVIEQLSALGPEQARWLGLAMAAAGTALYLLLRG